MKNITEFIIETANVEETEAKQVFINILNNQIEYKRSVLRDGGSTSYATNDGWWFRDLRTNHIQKNPNIIEYTSPTKEKGKFSL